MRVSNPVLRSVQKRSSENEIVNPATYGGIAGKTIMFAIITILSATLAFVLLLSVGFSYTIFVVISVVCPIIALICAIAASFAPRTAKFTGSLYAIFQGFAVGAISCLFELEIAGIVFSALLATFGTFLVMAVLYATGLIRVGSKFRKFMFVALISLLFVNLVMWIISLFSTTMYNAFYGTSVLSIIISAVMIIFAALMLLIDFDNASNIVKNGADKVYEWSVAFGLTVTLIWLYLEFLQLFARLSRR